MAVLNREAFLAAKPALKRRVVDVPELGEGAQVIVQEMTAAAREAYATAMAVMEGEQDPVEIARARAGTMYAHMLVASLVDEGGKQLFTEADVAELASWPASLIQRLSTVANELNSSAEAARKN